MAAMLVCVLLTCYATSAFAATYTNRTCDRCGKVTKFYHGCSGKSAGNSTYYQHEVGSDGTVCNYYLKYYKNKLTCQVCGNIYVGDEFTHLEAEIHNICGGKARCPF